MAHPQPLELEARGEAGRKTSFPFFSIRQRSTGKEEERRRRILPRRKRGGGKLRVTNLKCENLITVEGCVCAVVGWTLRRGSDTLKGQQDNQSLALQVFGVKQHPFL